MKLFFFIAVLFISEAAFAVPIEEHGGSQDAVDDDVVDDQTSEEQAAVMAEKNEYLPEDQMMTADGGEYLDVTRLVEELLYLRENAIDVVRQVEATVDMFTILQERHSIHKRASNGHSHKSSRNYSGRSSGRTTTYGNFEKSRRGGVNAEVGVKHKSGRTSWGAYGGYDEDRGAYGGVGVEHSW